MKFPNYIAPRRKNRILAFQYLYMQEFHKNLEFGPNFLYLIECYDERPEEYTFARELIKGTLENLDTIDPLIEKFSQNWTFSRIAKVDLSILRMAIYELLFRKDIPPIVSINEAIDLTKAFSKDDSNRFINGILDKVKEMIDRPLREASQE